jgi:uncharacterized YccA/Bax inhibitor family protein
MENRKEVVMKSGNPALSADIFRGFPATQETMTVQGTVNKTFLELLIVVAAASFTWQQYASGSPLVSLLLLVGTVGGFIFALITIFKREWAPVTAPIYGALEGFALGGISAYTNAAYPGIVIQAVGLTFGTLFALLAIYRSGLIRVTQQFRLGIAAATGGIMLVYLVEFALGFFGIHIPYINETGLVGIGFSLFVVAIAALNLVLDFDFIEQAAGRVPKYMEWYGAFGLLVTLVWLYLEMLRLLSKLQERR